jgi:hypothetical protein
MSMTEIRITPAAQAKLGELRAVHPEQARAVDAAIREIGTRTGEPLDIPGAPADTPFLALEISLREAPTVVYRRTRPDEPGDWLVVSLLGPEDYQNVRRAEVVISTTPVVRDIVGAVIAGTVATTPTTTPAGADTASQDDAVASTYTTVRRRD